MDSFVTETRIELLKENFGTRTGMLKGSSEMRRMMKGNFVTRMTMSGLGKSFVSRMMMLRQNFGWRA